MNSRRSTGLVILAMALALTACRTGHTARQVPLTTDDMPVLATQSDAFAAFGLPTNLVHHENGDTTLVYRYEKNVGKGLRLGISVPMFGVGWIHMFKGSDRLEVRIDSRGRVTGTLAYGATGEIERRLWPFDEARDESAAADAESPAEST